MSALGLYIMDGNDLFGVYGYAVSSGSDYFLKPPDTKSPVFKKEWPDQQGTEYDNSAPVYFKEKEIPITGAIFANDESDFWNKYNAFFNALSQPGNRRMYVAELKRSFYIRYDSCPSFTRLTRILNDTRGKIRCDYTLKFIEPKPSFWKPFAFLIDTNGDYITDGYNSKIIIT